jgi:Bacterial protein of unknown function (DUF922)
MMGGVRSGLLGTDAPALGGGDDSDDILGGGDPPGTLGINETEPMSTAKIGYVKKDWDRDSPEFTKPIIVSGATIDKLWETLRNMSEWGEGGGRLDLLFPRDFASSQSVVLKAHLVRRLVQWKEYDKVRDVEKAAWTSMYRKLMDHEDRHVEIAVEAAERLADELIGKTKDEGKAAQQAANARMRALQQKLDDDTDHGQKKGVKYGDVILDMSHT